MCNAIRLALALLKVVARFIAETCSVLFVPVIMFLVVVGFFIYWVVVAVYIYSTGTVVKNQTTFIASIQWDNNTRYAFWYHLFGLFYVSAFLSGVTQFVIACTGCFWYFEQQLDGNDNPNINRTKVLSSFYRVFRYHLGSIALGSLILAIIQFINFILSYIKSQMGDDNSSRLIKCLIDCVQCCLDCCERFIEFINRHAYIQMAITGENFCSAASSGFGVIIRNLGRTSALAAIGGVFQLLGLLFVACGTGIIGYEMIININSINSQLNSPILPVIVMVIFGYTVGYIFMSVYSMSQDTFLQCFLVDEDTNNGTAKFAPSELHAFYNAERPPAAGQNQGQK